MSLTRLGRHFVFFALLLMVALLMVALLMAAPASAQVVGLEQQGGAVAGVDADGETAWTIQHRLDEEDEGAVKPLRFEPVIDGRRAYYAIDSDLLTLDLDAGKIVERRRFPGVIDAMKPDGDRYKLKLFARALVVHKPEESSAIEVRYQPGDPAPGTGLFEEPLILTASDDALAVAGVRRDRELESLSAEDTQRALERLEAAEKRDPTNLFLPIYGGRVAQFSQNEQPAAEIFERAAQLKDAPWSDDLLASFILLKYGQDALSKKLAARAKEKMLAGGVLIDRLNSSVLQTGLSAAIRTPLSQSIEGGDVERVDDLLGRVAEFFPQSEQSMLTWRWMADWMDAQKQPETAQLWRGRAAKASHAPLVALKAESARKADRALLFWVALLVSALLIPLGVGLRPTGRRTAKGMALPDVTIWDGLGLLALLVACAILPAIVQENTTVSATQMSAPSELLDSAYDSPKVSAWLDGLADSPGRSAWLGYANKAQDALREGSRAEEPPPSEQLLADAIVAGPRDGSAALNAAGEVERLASLGRITQVVLVLLTIVLFMLIGTLIRHWAPKAARYIRMAIPGSAKVIAPIAVPLCALVSAAFLALFFELDRRVRTMVLPRTGGIFEHGELVATYLTRPSTWVALAAALLTLHALTIWSEDNKIDATESSK